MSLPHLLLVDDSEAILEFERAALSAHYTLSMATDGMQALQKVQQLRPDAVLLDLSMPKMTGDEVLARLKATPELASIPVLIVSSEKHRGEECKAHGAAGFIEKPLRADTLVLSVGRVLEEQRMRDRARVLAVLLVQISDLELGIPLEAVRSVVDQPATLPMPTGPAHLSRYFDLHGEPVLMLDLARRLGVRHWASVVDRKVVVMSEGALVFAVSVDGVRDPEEFLPADVVLKEHLGGAAGNPEFKALRAIVRTPRGHIPVISPDALLDEPVDELMRRVQRLDLSHLKGQA